MAALKVGDRAPDFELKNQDGETIKLSTLLKNGPAVVYFYPKDETAGCTAEACAFRDRFDVFQQAGASVVGISSDSVESHSGFASHHNLPFLLLADTEGAVRKSWNVTPAFLGLFPGRMTFVIDRLGIVQHVFTSNLNMTKHVDEAIAMVQKLAQPAVT